jgi:hypothetical protein
MVKARRSIQSNKDSGSAGKFGLIGGLVQDKGETQSESNKVPSKKPEPFKFTF